MDARRIVPIVGGVLLAFFAIALPILFRLGPVPNIGDRAVIKETVIQERPVRIATSSDPKIFTKSWRTSPNQASTEAIESDEIERTTRILNEAVKKYPPHILRRNLKTVYVLSRLNYRGISASETNSK